MTRILSVMKAMARSGKVSEARVATAVFLPVSTRHTLLLGLTQVTRLPLAKEQTPRTQSQVLLDSSSPKGILEPHGIGAGCCSLKGILEPHGIAAGLQLPEGHLRAPCYGGWLLFYLLDWAEKILHLKSQEPTGRSTLLGCQSRLRTVERMGFLICLHTHLSSSCSNKGWR